MDPDVAPLQPGTVLTTATLSPCVGGLVRTWTDVGSRLWAPDDPEAMRALMGRGALARSPVGPDRFREAGLLDADNGTLVLQPRYPLTAVEHGVTVDARVISLAEPREPTDDATTELLDYFQAAIQHCEATGELLILETGDHPESPNRPYCLWTLQEHDGAVLSVLETSPVPTESTLWAAPENPDDDGAGMTAPATRAVIDAARFLLLDAMTGWGVDPWDTALTFWRPPASTGD